MRKSTTTAVMNSLTALSLESHSIHSFILLITSRFLLALAWLFVHSSLSPSLFFHDGGLFSLLSLSNLLLLQILPRPLNPLLLLPFLALFIPLLFLLILSVMALCPTTPPHHPLPCRLPLCCPVQHQIPLLPLPRQCLRSLPILPITVLPPLSRTHR